LLEEVEMKRIGWCAAACLVLSLAFAGCTKKPAATGNTSTAGAQTGVASWYGHPFDGRQTANQEIFDMEKLTAAHRTLPFGTVVHVTNQSNGKTVDVRVNDRGPFVANRIIDLSHAAAQVIAMPSIATVNLQIISLPHTRAVQSFAVQVGEFASRPDADLLATKMRAQYGEASVVSRPGDQSWRVLTGRFQTEEAATTFSNQIGSANGTMFVVAVDEE
jgi:rare lipoprotein A